jgi:hypothetical protein
MLQKIHNIPKRIHGRIFWWRWLHDYDRIIFMTTWRFSFKCNPGLGGTLPAMLNMSTGREIWLWVALEIRHWWR